MNAVATCSQVGTAFRTLAGRSEFKEIELDLVPAHSTAHDALECHHFRRTRTFAILGSWLRFGRISGLIVLVPCLLIFSIHRDYLFLVGIGGNAANRDGSCMSADA